MDIISHGMDFYKVKLYLSKKYLIRFIYNNKIQQTGNHINAV